MPAMNAFGRKWSIASDDFVFPGITMLFIRLVWLIVIGSTAIVHSDTFSKCRGGHLLQSFYYGMLVLLPLKIAINILLIHFSRQGSITNYGVRRYVPRVLYAKFTLFLLEVIWLVIGAVWSFRDYHSCDWTVVLAVRTITMFSWLGALIFFIMIAFLVSPFGHGELDSSQIWKRRCRYLCCSYSSDADTNNAYTEVANLVATYFQADQASDLVPTDIAAGLVLIGRKRAALADSLTSVSVVDPTRQISDRHQAMDVSGEALRRNGLQPAPWMTMNRACRMMRYAQASYGWPLYSYSNLPFGCCVVCCGSPSEDIYKKENVVEDNICGCHMTAVDRHIKSLRSYVYYASFHNSLFNNPFLIIMDHDYKSVVVAIRGTLSLKDALVDITATGEAIDSSQPSHMAHKGMLRAARNLHRKLLEDNLLSSAFESSMGEYKLVICGHSLGAGVAAILALLMRKQYPNLQCFAFSPPGGLLSEEACQDSVSNTMSIVVGDDMVPRLAIHTMEDLRVDLIQSINDCQSPKYRIFFSAGLKAVSCCSGDEETEQPLVSSRQNSYNSQHSSLSDAIESRNMTRITQLKFYPPGAIMYITDANSRSSRKCCNDRHYSWRWASHTDFPELIISPRMVGDHLPDVVLDALTILAPDYPDEVVTHTSHLDVQPGASHPKT